jgi:Protein of unknown function (DUF3014)
MDELSDYELQKTDEESAPAGPGRTRPRVLWIAAAAIVAAGVPAYFWFPRPPEASTSTAPTVAYRPLPAAASAAPAIDVPPLDETDPLVRRLVSALSSHPRVAAWLTTTNLLRTFTVAVENITTGATPARHLRVLRPVGPFRVVEDGEVMHIDPRSYERYDGIADAVASIDAAGAATLYSTLRPRFDEAYRELGHADGFDAALERAIAMLVRIPVPATAVPLVYKGALNAFADPRLEELTDAEKQFLRVGPRNMRLIQGKLREIAAALGMSVSGQTG